MADNLFGDFLDFMDGDDEVGMENMLDLDGDGLYESIAIDGDGDGYAETIVSDFDLDGVFESGMSDTDINGTYETIGVDSDIDGIIDTFYSDLDDNGMVEFVATDDDGDGVFDVIAADDNEDGIFDSVYEDVDGEWVEIDMNSVGGAPAYDGYESYDPTDSDGVIGDPTDAMESWHSQTGNTCAVVSQEFILEDILDREFDEDELRELAEENGWYNNGTAPEDVGNLLEYYGIETQRSEGNSFEDLRDSLADGNKIIVAVDSDELWNGQSNDFFGPGMDADHAIQVVGIDESDPDDIKIIINDSGVANGQCVEVPVDQFMEAWEDGNGFMVEAFPVE